VEVLHPAMMAWGQLERLDLGSNCSGPDGMRLLASALCNTPVLSYLNFHDNLLGEEGSEVLAELLPRLCWLRGLA